LTPADDILHICFLDDILHISLGACFPYSFDILRSFRGVCSLDSFLDWMLAARTLALFRIRLSIPPSPHPYKRTSYVFLAMVLALARPLQAEY
jgi:hypothetical protein